MRHVYKFLLVLTVIFAFFMAAVAAVVGTHIIGCGGLSDDSSSTTTLIIDSADVPLSSGQTVEDPTSLTITFESSRDPDIVTAAGSVTLTCGGLNATITVALAPDDADDGVIGNKYTVTVSEPYKYQKMECTLTVGSIATGSSPYTLRFNTSCAVSDDFNSDSSTCWEVYDTSTDFAIGWSGWSGILDSGILSFNTAGSTLDYDATVAGGAESYAIFHKRVTVTEPAEIAFKVNTISGVDDLSEGGSPDMVAVFLSENPGFGPSMGRVIILSVRQGVWDGEYATVGSSWYFDGQANTGISLGVFDVESDFYVRLIIDDSAYTPQFSNAGETYQDMTLLEGAFSTGIDFSIFNYMSLVFIDHSEDNQASVDSVVVSNITSEGQYCLSF